MQVSRSWVVPPIGPVQLGELQTPLPQHCCASAVIGRVLDGQPYLASVGFATQSRMHWNSPVPVGPPEPQRSPGLVPKQAAKGTQHLSARHAMQASLTVVSHWGSGVETPGSHATVGPAPAVPPVEVPALPPVLEPALPPVAPPVPLPPMPPMPPTPPSPELTTQAGISAENPNETSASAVQADRVILCSSFRRLETP